MFVGSDFGNVGGDTGCVLGSLVSVCISNDAAVFSSSCWPSATTFCSSLSVFFFFQNYHSFLAISSVISTVSSCSISLSSSFASSSNSSSFPYIALSNSIHSLMVLI